MERPEGVALFSSAHEPRGMNNVCGWLGLLRACLAEGRLLLPPPPGCSWNGLPGRLAPRALAWEKAPLLLLLLLQDHIAEEDFWASRKPGFPPVTVCIHAWDAHRDALHSSKGPVPNECALSGQALALARESVWFCVSIFSIPGSEY